MKRARCDHHNNFAGFNRRGSNFLAHGADKCALATQLPPDQRTAQRRNRGGPNHGGEAQEWPVGGVITMDIYEVELCHRGRWEQQDARFVAARNADEAAYKVTGIQLRSEGERRKIRLRVRRLGNGSPPPTLFYAE